MKKTLLTAAIIGCVVLAAAAQTPPPPDPPATTIEARPAESPPAPEADLLKTIPSISPEQLDTLIRFQAETASRVWGIHFAVDGVIPRARRVGNPLQLINPFAPAHYGSGEDVTSFDPRTGQAEGIVFLGIRF